MTGDMDVDSSQSFVYLEMTEHVRCHGLASPDLGIPQVDTF